MNEFDILLKPDVVKTVESEARREKKYLGTVRLYKGQKLWELDLVTKDVKEVVITTATVNMEGVPVKDYVTKEGCLYAVALNRANAERKFIMQARELGRQYRLSQ